MERELEGDNGGAELEQKGSACLLLVCVGWAGGCVTREFVCVHMCVHVFMHGMEAATKCSFVKLPET